MAFRIPYKVMVVQLNFNDSRYLCERLFRTDVYAPLTSEQNDQLYTDALPFIKKCKPMNHGYSYFWLGISDEAENGVWRSLNVSHS